LAQWHRNLHSDAALNESANLVPPTPGVNRADKHFTRSAIIDDASAAYGNLDDAACHARDDRFALAMDNVWDGNFLADFESNALFKSKARLSALKMRIIARSRRPKIFEAGCMRETAESQQPHEKNGST
jgi:hypothetical protein